MSSIIFWKGSEGTWIGFKGQLGMDWFALPTSIWQVWHEFTNFDTSPLIPGK